MNQSDSNWSAEYVAVIKSYLMRGEMMYAYRFSQFQGFRYVQFVLFAMLIIAVSMSSSVYAQDAQNASLPFVSSLFSDNMVLQRGQSDPVWGWTTPGAKVTVTFAGKKVSGIAGQDGKWLVKLPPFTAGGPYTMNIVGPDSSQIKFSNILVGDVWLCSGQSNMEFGVGNLLNPDQEIAAANYPKIRLFAVPRDISLTPKKTTGGAWEICTPDNLRKDGVWGGFTAVGYFFGRDLYENLHVPIGLVHSSWGGTPAEAWTSESALGSKMTDFQAQLSQLDAAKNTASPSIQNNPNFPTVLYNGMISPLIPFGMKGAIWYQGESNAGNAYQYRTLLPVMITDWRQRWGADFPFLIVQLAGFMRPPAKPGDDAWAELREAQWLTTKAIPNTWIATAMDIGNETDIHPKDKQDVGKRLALAAEANVYHEKVPFYGPVYQSMKVEGDKIILTFSHLDGGLVAKGGDLKGFAIAGDDRKWVWANAKIVGNKVEVSSPDVPQPVAVRYGWASYLDVNLYNKAGLPAFPFRTDDWRGITQHN
jgi:sialate O-acetylesterase